MFTVSLPFLDATGKLTPFVVEALAAGATSAHDPDDAAKIVLIFEDEDARDAFAELIEDLD